MINFENYMEWYLKEDILGLADLVASNQWNNSYYYLRAFYPFNYGDSRAFEGNFSKDNIKSRFKGVEYLYKRPMGLWLEYMLVEEFKLETNINDYATGVEAWDFIWNDEKVDLKISLKNKAKKIHNISKYNREIVLNELDIYIIIEMLRVGRTDPNYKKMREIILHNVMKKALDTPISKTYVGR